MNDYKKLKHNSFYNKRLCIKYLKSKFQTEIDNTLGNKGISYNDFLTNEEEQRKPWVINMRKYYEKEKYKNYTEDKINRDIYRLYYGSINIFKPSIAKWLCDKFEPSTVLDPFSGWASRMIGCTSSGCKYIGIDNNKNLVQGYNEIREELDISNLTEIIFDDCLKIDYSKYDYDMVLTSPPYYNIELYSYTEKRRKKKWNEFYKEIFQKLFDGLKINGYFCINVNTEIYEKVLKPMLGEAFEKIEYPKNYRRKQKVNSEYIYIWIKH